MDMPSLRRDGDIRAPIVFDNLIAKGDLPVTIGIFLNPGHRGEKFPESRWKSNNRSYEYDSLGDGYARFLLEEILPSVSKKYNLSDKAKTVPSVVLVREVSVRSQWLGSVRMPSPKFSV